MDFVKTALAALAGVALSCGAAMAGDEDAQEKEKRVLDKVEKKLEQEREKVKGAVEKILDEELANEGKKKGDKDEKKADKAVARPWLGVFLGEADGGASVEGVMDASPAEKAGLKEGDVVAKVDGKDVESSRSLIAAVAEKKPGDEVKLDVRRGKDSVTLVVKLGTRPEELPASFAAPGDDDEDEAEDDDDNDKEEGKKGPGPDELRARIRKFMDRMKGDRDKGDEKDEDKDEAKKPHKKGGKDLLDRALGDGKKKKHDEEEGKDEGGPDLGNFEEMARRFMEEFMKPRDRGEGDEEEGPGADDPMGRVMEWFQSEDGQKMMEELQPLIEKLMEDENIQKMIEELMQGQGMQPDEDEEEGEELTAPPKREKPERAEKPSRPSKPAAAYLGVSPAEMSEDLRDQLDLKGGVVLNDVVEGGPGAKAGLRKNDVVLAIDGTDIEGVEDVRSILAKHKPGDEIELVVLRKGKKKTVTVELGKKGAMATEEGDRRHAVLPEDLRERLQSAQEDFEQALRLDPSVGEAADQLRDAFERRGERGRERFDKARHDIERAMKALEGKEGAEESDRPAGPGEKDPAKWMLSMARFAKAFAKDKELYWDVTDKDGKVVWRQRFDPDNAMKLAARLGENEAKRAEQALAGATTTEWQCEEECCKAKRANGEKTSAGRRTRRDMPQWRKDLRSAIEKAIRGRGADDDRND